MLPWERILQDLDNVGFMGPVSIETHNPQQGVADVDQSRKTHDAIKRAWPSAAPGFIEELPIKGPVVRDYKPVGIVIVGLGMGHNRAKSIMQTPGTKLVGLVDRDEERARRSGEEFHVPATRELKPWLENPEAELVYVLTPTGTHGAVAMEALAAGKHVLTTKPMEASLAACDEMIRLAEKKGVLLAVDFDRRFLPGVLSLRQTIQNKRLGRILGAQLTLKVLRTMEYYRSGGGWRGTRRLDGGGILSNQSIHLIDEMSYTLGVPARVKCEVRTQTHQIEAEDLGCAWWEYPDGAIVSMMATTSYPHLTWYQQTEIWGTTGAGDAGRRADRAEHLPVLH